MTDSFRFLMCHMGGIGICSERARMYDVGIHTRAAIGSRGQLF